MTYFSEKAENIFAEYKKTESTSSEANKISQAPSPPSTNNFQHGMKTLSKLVRHYLAIRIEL
jgi:hypothetical protein